jgi:23S rRNA (cytosine1962-C5)-methyltransferase
MTPRIILRKGRERRQFMGHPWVYEGEIATVKGHPADGDVVDCMSWQGAFLGRGYINSRSKIRVRIMTRHAAEAVDDALLRQRLVQALAYRQRLYPEATSLRLVHAEGDLLPGLTVDRYEDVLVMQCASLGMDRRQDVLAGFLQELTGIEHIYRRNDISVRRNDGLELGHGFLGAPFPTAKPIRSGGLTFEIDVAEGHKTGFYLDQDAFCYSGAFALHAAAAGAETVLGVDSSEPALELARRNAEQNALQERCRFEPGNVFDTLRQLAKDGQQFDLIVLDPPSFTRNRDAVAKALSGYKEINLRALKLLRPGGRLMTFTCSYYVDRGLFEDMLQDASGNAKRHVIVRQRLSQAGHHPEVLSVPETGYLKGMVAEV